MSLSCFDSLTALRRNNCTALSCFDCTAWRRELRKLRTAAKQAHSCENCGATIRYRDDCQLERASRACLAGHFDFSLPGAFCENYLLLQSKIISHCPEFIGTFPMSCVPNFWPALERFPARPTKIPVVYRFCKRISMDVLSLWSAARS